MKGVFSFLAAMAVCMSVWLAVPSSLFLRPIDVLIVGYQVTVTREYPLSGIFGAPHVAYVETVRDLNNISDPCVETNGRGFRYNTSKNVARWNIESWAAPCMTGEYQWQATWTVKLFGIIPLRPVELSKIVRIEE